MENSETNYHFDSVRKEKRNSLSNKMLLGIATTTLGIGFVKQMTSRIHKEKRLEQSIKEYRLEIRRLNRKLKSGKYTDRDIVTAITERVRNLKDRIKEDRKVLRNLKSRKRQCQ